MCMLNTCIICVKQVLLVFYNTPKTPHVWITHVLHVVHFLVYYGLFAHVFHIFGWSLMEIILVDTCGWAVFVCDNHMVVDITVMLLGSLWHHSDIAWHNHCDVTICHDIDMGTHHDITMENNIVKSLIYMYYHTIPNFKFTIFL